MADADPEAPDAAPGGTPRAGVRKVHHLSCGSGCLVGRHDIVCHVLLVETEHGLVLVDTGLGTEQVTSPPKNTGRSFQWGFRPRNDVNETALTQLKALGYRAEDVRHIVLTHLDFDHAGGLPDFPHATVHVHEAELAVGQARATFFERARYQPGLWAHDVKWQPHSDKGERWYGFPCVRDLAGLPPEILLVPLQGHTRGHAGVAVDVGGRWILHCGDAYFH
ncbi:MAG TPA: MBL fold metallo-hydrolase, partial [Myxococcota bacterium]